MMKNSALKQIMTPPTVKVSPVFAFGSSLRIKASPKVKTYMALEAMKNRKNECWRAVLR